MKDSPIEITWTCSAAGESPYFQKDPITALPVVPDSVFQSLELCHPKYCQDVPSPRHPYRYVVYSGKLSIMWMLWTDYLSKKQHQEYPSSFLWSTQGKLIVKDRKGKTSPIRATGFNQPAQPVWATKLFFDGKLCIFLLRQQFSAADQGTQFFKLRSAVRVLLIFQRWSLGMSSWSPWKKGSKLTFQTALWSSSGNNKISMKLLPSQNIQEVEKKISETPPCFKSYFHFQFEATWAWPHPLKV